MFSIKRLELAGKIYLGPTVFDNISLILVDNKCRSIKNTREYDRHRALNFRRAWERRPCRPAIAPRWRHRLSVWTVVREGLRGITRAPGVEAAAADPPYAHPFRRTPPPFAPATPTLAPARTDSAILQTIKKNFFSFFIFFNNF